MVLIYVIFVFDVYHIVKPMSWDTFDFAATAPSAKQGTPSSQAPAPEEGWGNGARTQVSSLSDRASALATKSFLPCHSVIAQSMKVFWPQGCLEC